MKKKVLIFIITYKAKDLVYKVFKKIDFKSLRSYKINLLISDDFSNDSTINFCNKIKKKYPSVKLNFNKKNLGYGGNIKKCLSFAILNNFDYAVMIHGDGQYSPIYIKKLLENFNTNKFYAVTGSRLTNGLKKTLKGGMPFYKLIGNIFLTSIFNLVFKTNFKDAHTGLWAYKVKLFKKINLKSLGNTFNFDQDLRIKLIENNFHIKEIPIKTIYANERSQLHIFYASKFLLITLYHFVLKLVKL